MRIHGVWIRRCRHKWCRCEGCIFPGNRAPLYLKLPFISRRIERGHCCVFGHCELSLCDRIVSGLSDERSLVAPPMLRKRIRERMGNFKRPRKSS